MFHFSNSKHVFLVSITIIYLVAIIYLFTFYVVKEGSSLNGQTKWDHPLLALSCPSFLSWSFEAFCFEASKKAKKKIKGVPKKTLCFLVQISFHKVESKNKGFEASIALFFFNTDWREHIENACVVINRHQNFIPFCIYEHNRRPNFEG